MYQTPKGTKDLGPDEMIRREYVISVISRIFQKYGFDPMDSPAFEEWALLSAKSGGGEEIKQEIYYFKDKSDRELGLRFELTTSLCRFVANNSSLPKPFRRYMIGKVWRYDNPSQLRWREFTQADIDIIGAQSMDAEAEYISAICEIFSRLGFGDFEIKMNNRKITESFVRSLGVKDIAGVFRSIDKISKIGESEVYAELKSKGVALESIKKILSFISLTSLDEVEAKLGKGSEGVEELRKIIDLAGENSRFLKPDMSLVRGLDYYTGPVFEISLGKGVSVGGGGRYDDLIEVFGGKPTPATGISIGIDRLVSVMEERNMLDMEQASTKIFVVNVSESVIGNARQVAREIRSQGIACEYDITGRSLSKQLAYVNSRKIPWAMVLGEKEINSGKAKLRNMSTGDEVDVNLGALATVKKLFSAV
jgi:histidyl-tRNA synthetase